MLPVTLLVAAQLLASDGGGHVLLGTAPTFHIGSGIDLDEGGSRALRLRLGGGVRRRLVGSDEPGWAPVAAGVYSLSVAHDGLEHWALLNVGWGRFGARLPGVPLFESYLVGGAGFQAREVGFRAGVGLNLNLAPLLYPRFFRKRPPPPPKPERDPNVLSPPPLVEGEVPPPQRARPRDTSPEPPPPQPRLREGPDLTALVAVGALALVALVPTGLAVSAQFVGVAITLTMLPSLAFMMVTYAVYAFLVSSAAVATVVSFANVELVLERPPGEDRVRPRLLFGLRF